MGFWLVTCVLNAISWSSRIKIPKRCKYTNPPLFLLYLLLNILFSNQMPLPNLYGKSKCGTQMLFSLYFCLLCSWNVFIKIFSIMEISLHLTSCHTKTQTPDKPVFHTEVVLKAHCALLQCKSLCISSYGSWGGGFVFEPITWGNGHSCSGPHYACLLDLLKKIVKTV